MSRVEELEREVKALRRIVQRHAEDAQLVIRQEGPAVHGYCEGHAVCDMVSTAIFDAKELK